MRELYRSENGDVWRLGQDGDGIGYIQHVPNAPSGGLASRIEIGAFLANGRRGAEHLALLRLIGELAIDSEVSTPSDA